MSEGEILLTKERMENSIPYISLNSCEGTQTFSELLRPRTQLSDSLVYLVFGDARLLLAVPFVIIQAAAVAVKYVQVVDGHLRTGVSVVQHRGNLEGIRSGRA